MSARKLQTGAVGDEQLVLNRCSWVKTARCNTTSKHYDLQKGGFRADLLVEVVTGSSEWQLCVILMQLSGMQSQLGYSSITPVRLSGTEWAGCCFAPQTAYATASSQS